MKNTFHHAINLVSSYMLVWGAYTAITADISYIAFLVFLIGLFSYLVNNDNKGVRKNVSIYSTRCRSYKSTRARR